MYGVLRGGCQTQTTWTEVVQKDCQACKLNRDDAIVDEGS